MSESTRLIRYKLAERLGRARFEFDKWRPELPQFHTTAEMWDDLFEFRETLDMVSMLSRQDPGFGVSLNGYSYTAAVGAINRRRTMYQSPYDEVAFIYDELDNDGAVERENRELAEMLAPHLRVPGTTVLDVGCGTGLLLTLFPEIAPEAYFGFDPSQGMLRRFSAVHPRYAHRVLPCAIADWWPMPGDRVDVAVALFEAGDVFTAEDIDKLPKMARSWFIMETDRGAENLAEREYGITLPRQEIGGPLEDLGSTEVGRIAYYRVMHGRA